MIRIILILLGVIMSNEYIEIIEDAEKCYADEKYFDANNLYKQAYRKYSSLFTDEQKEHFAKAIYESEIRDSVSYDDNLEIKINFLLSLVGQKDTTQGQSCPYTDSVISIMKACKRNAEKTLYWSEKLNPQLLNPDPIKNNSYSDRQTWYSNTTKALLKSKEFSKCLKISKEALENVDGIMNDDQYWFKFRVAVCNRELRNFEEAVKDFKEVLKYKNIWSNQKELAETYYQMDDLDNALKVSLEAALTNSKVILDKVKLYELMEQIFKDKGMEKEAQEIAYLIYAVKSRVNHQITYDDDAFELEEAGYDLSNLDYVSIEKEIREDWSKILNGL